MRNFLTTGLILCIAILINSCWDKPTNVENHAPSITSISPETVWRGDTLTIITKGFSTDSTAFTVQIDTFIIKPIFVENNVIKIIIPEGMTKNKYEIVVRKSGETAHSVQKITLDPIFKFRHAMVTVNLKGKYKNNSSSSQNLTKTIYVYGCDSYSKGNPIEFNLGCNSSVSGYNNSKYNKLTATVDSSTKIISKLYAKDYLYESTRTGPGPFNTTTNISDFSLNLQNAHYTEFNNRIEINYSGQTLSEIIPKVIYQNNSDYFTSSNEFSNNSFVTIVLYY